MAHIVQSYQSMKKTKLYTTTLLLALLWSTTAYTQNVIKVAAAANLRDVMGVIVELYRSEQRGKEVEIEVGYGASSRFVQQILNGAKYDIFLSADSDYPRKLKEQSGIKGEVTPYAYGRLALCSTTIDVSTKALSALSKSSIRRVAIANPSTAPYGAKAIELLHSQKLFDTLKSKIVYGENISTTAHYVFTGSADIGLIALSLLHAPASEKIKVYSYTIPEQMHTPIEQSCIVINDENSEVKRFRDFLISAKCDAIWESFGYRPVKR